MVEEGNIPSNGARSGLVVSYTHVTKGAAVLAPRSLRRIRSEMSSSRILIMVLERVSKYDFIICVTSL